MRIILPIHIGNIGIIISHCLDSHYQYNGMSHAGFDYCPTLSHHQHENSHANMPACRVSQPCNISTI